MRCVVSYNSFQTTDPHYINELEYFEGIKRTSTYLFFL